MGMTGPSDEAGSQLPLRSGNFAGEPKPIWDGAHFAMVWSGNAGDTSHGSFAQLTADSGQLSMTVSLPSKTIL